MWRWSRWAWNSVESHKGWINDINETQNVEVNSRLSVMKAAKLPWLYDMIHPNASLTATVRSLFIIAPDKTIKLMITYPASTGRNFQEILRVIDSLQLYGKLQRGHTADWKDGEDVIVVPAVKTEDIPAKFPKGFTQVKPYLRTTPQPNK